LGACCWVTTFAHKAVGKYLEDTMKSIALAAALSIAATSAFAGAMTEPVMEPEVIVEDSSSSGGVLVPLLILLIVWAAINA